MRAGPNAYTVRVRGDGAGDKTISGDAALTYFPGPYNEGVARALLPRRSARSVTRPAASWSRRRSPRRPACHDARIRLVDQAQLEFGAVGEMLSASALPASSRCSCSPIRTSDWEQLERALCGDQ